MGVFINNLKTFTSDITGEEREYKINNAIWVFMKSKFGLTQKQWQDLIEEEENLAGVKLVCSIMMANGLKVTEKEISENTDPLLINSFIIKYQTAMAERALELSPKEDDEEEDENF